MTKYCGLLFTPLLLMMACSDEPVVNKEKSHLLEGQLRAIDKAKGIEKVIQEALDRRHEIEK